MKTLRQISAVTILCLTLAVSVMAGQTDTPGAPAPEKPKSSTTQPTGPAASILLMVLSLIYR